jgi:hypothetical protein
VPEELPALEIFSTSARKYYRAETTSARPFPRAKLVGGLGARKYSCQWQSPLASLTLLVAIKEVTNVFSLHPYL